MGTVHSGLCVGQRDIRRDESFPRPSIHAWPSSIVPANSNVTVRCSTTAQEVNFRGLKFALKGERNVMKSTPSPDSPGDLVEFHLSGVKTSDAGEYTCEYYRKGSPTIRSPPSDVLLLLVTGNFPKPSLHAHPGRKVTAGENVILQCEKPRHVTEPHTFALLKKGTSTPIQLRSAVGMETDFSLPSVTGSDTGAYSCVYYQTRAPFWASEISDELTISVTGLCAGQDLRRDGSFPRPSICAWPSSVPPANSDVTLQCSTPAGEVDFRDIKFVLRKNNASFKFSPDSPGGLAEFHLRDVKLSDAGEYTCEYYRTGRPTRRSPPSDVLLLLVTGFLPKPSLHARPGRKVTAGENVTLQCQKPSHVTEPHMFALLKKGTSTPIQLQSAVGMETDFFLPSVTGSDTGAYSCVYHQPRAPFWASEPSDHLSIWVTDAPGATSTDYTTGNLIRLGLSALITVLMVAFLVEAWWSQRRSPSGSSN